MGTSTTPSSAEQAPSSTIRNVNRNGHVTNGYGHGHTGSKGHSVALPIAAPADPVTARKLINSMKKPASSLVTTYDGLHGQTMQVALLGGEVGTVQDITDLRQQMRDQDQRQKEGIEEIQLILDDMLQNNVVEGMRKQVEQEIVDQIDELVKEHIAECLKVHIPQELQDDVADSKRELEEIRLALHNSDSRRANANLRSNRPDEPLHTIYMSNGTVSPLFPKDLKSLFELDATSTKALMVDYDIPDPTDSKDRNLNRVMQFLGVRYQLVAGNSVRPGAEKRTVLGAFPR